MMEIDSQGVSAVGGRRSVCGAWLAAVALWAVAAAAGRLAAQAPPPSGQGGAAPAAPFQAPGTRKMVEMLARLRDAQDPGAAVYLNTKRVAVLRAKVGEATNLQTELKARVQLAAELILAGHPEEALAEYALVDGKLGAVKGGLTERGRQELLIHKATAWLRIGELANCVSNHNIDSCLLPLRGGAIHRNPEGSRRAIGFLNEELNRMPGDLMARWLLNIAHMTLGEYPDKVPPQFLIPPSVFESEYALPRFPDIAAGVGLDTANLAGGVILEDFDGDGFLDVVTSNWALTGQLRYFHNDGNGHFTDRTAEAGLTGIVGGLNIQQTDYNNDGLPDIWMLRGAWFGKGGRLPCSLLRNNGDGTFTDVTEEAGLLRFHPTQTSSWFDYDGDGWLDVFIGNESLDPNDPDPCELFHNNGNGTFTECALTSGIDVKAFVKGVTSADYDNDGRPDLFLSLQGGENILFHNDGPADPSSPSGARWKFTETSQRAGVTGTLWTFPTWFFDYDNDGFEDLMVFGYHIANVGDIAADYLGLPHHAALPKLYHNNHDGTFTDVTAAAHLNRVCLAMGCNFGDLDNDGWLDFYLGTGNPNLTTLIPNRMFRNEGGKFFQDVTTATDTGNLQKGHAVAFGDLDNDGFEDVYIVLGGAYEGDGFQNALYHNPGNTNHWIKLKLSGVKANRAAIGARLKFRVTTPSGPRDIYKTVNSGGSFGSGPLMQQVGLGDATGVESLEVLWPGSGLKQTLRGLALDSAYKLKEGDPEATPWKLQRIPFGTDAPAGGHVHHHPTSTP